MHVTGTLKNPKVSGVVLKDAGEQVRRYIIFNLWEQQKAETSEGGDEADD